MSAIVFTRLTVNSTPTDTTKVHVYCKSMPSVTGAAASGKAFLRYDDGYGYDVTLQPHFGLNRIGQLSPSTGAAFDSFGMGLTGYGTISTPTMSVSDKVTQTKRTRFSPGAGANALAGVSSVDNELLCSSTANTGGFFYLARFATTTLTTDGWVFAGINVGVPTATVNYGTATTVNARVGMAAANAASGSVYSMIHSNGTTCSSTAFTLGGGNATVVTTKLYEIILFQRPGVVTAVDYRVSDLVSGGSTRTSGTLATTLPLTGTFLSPLVGMGSLTGVGAISMDISKIYLETDD